MAERLRLVCCRKYRQAAAGCKRVGRRAAPGHHNPVLFAHFHCLAPAITPLSASPTHVSCPVIRFIGPFLIVVLALTTLGRAASPGMAQASCGGDMIAADICQMPGLPVQPGKPDAKSCCPALPDVPVPVLNIPPEAQPVGWRLQVAGLAESAGGASPWRPPQA